MNLNLNYTFIGEDAAKSAEVCKEFCDLFVDMYKFVQVKNKGFRKSLLDSTASYGIIVCRKMSEHAEIKSPIGTMPWDNFYIRVVDNSSYKDVPLLFGLKLLLEEDAEDMARGFGTRIINLYSKL